MYIDKENTMTNSIDISEFHFVPTREMLLSEDGNPKGKGIFWETDFYSDVAIYTFREEDYHYNGKVLYSLKALYMQCNDPTEYIFANIFFLNFAHWKKVSERVQIKRKIQEWREELALKLQAQGMRNVIQSSYKGDLGSSRWLAKQGWLTEKPRSPKVVQNTEALEEFKEDLDRLGTLVSLPK